MKQVIFGLAIIAWLVGWWRLERAWRAWRLKRDPYHSVNEGR